MNIRILIACIGNIFLGDDAFGVEVSRSLLSRTLPSEVTVKDFGVRGFDLAYALLEPWRSVILVDALARDAAPGTLFVLEPDINRLCDLGAEGMDLSPHSMDPMRVLSLAVSMGPVCARVLIVGCVPKDFGDEFEGRMGLSSSVQAAVEEAANMIEELVASILGEDQQKPMQLHAVER